MRKLLSVLCLLMICVLIPSLAAALTQSEWNHECRSKTRGVTILYSKDENGELTPTGSLPGGTYIKLGAYDYDRSIWDIAYWSDGSRASAWVMRDNVTSAETIVHFSDGTSVSLPEALVCDTSALQVYIRRQYPGKAVNGSGSEPVSIDGTKPLPPNSAGNNSTDVSDKDEISESSTEFSGSTTASHSKHPAEPTGLTAMLNGSTVEVCQLGVYQSFIMDDGVQEIVLTKDLIFADDVPFDKAIAVIYAPNTGKCTLRQKATDSAKSLGKCKAGTIVAVLEYGQKYCKISYDGEVGYVRTSCLKFYGDTDAPTGTGTLTYNGKATGRTTINIRNAADGGSHKIAKWRTGTVVVVFGMENGWYEIESDGMHGFVQKKFLTIDE